MTGRRPGLTTLDRAFPSVARLVGVALVGLVLLASAAAAGEAAPEGGPGAAAQGWWSALSPENKVLFCIAFFFSALFLWQFAMTLIGLAGGGADVEAQAGADVDADVDADADFHADAGHLDHDVGGAHEIGAHETDVSFRLLSVRSVVAGGTLFGWAGALYLYNGVRLSTALLYALAWAFGGALIVAILMYLMRRMQETGTPQLVTCVGQPATVYMDIPEAGAGKVRTVVSGAVSYVAARSACGKALKAGTPVRVKRLLDPSTVEVEPTDA